MIIYRYKEEGNKTGGKKMYKDYRYINAGENEFYRWGRKAIEKAEAALTPNEKGFYSIPADGGKYWTFGTSEGRYGEFAKWHNTFFSVNRGGFLWAKEGTPKAEAFKEMINEMIADMKRTHQEHIEAARGEN